MIRKSLLLTLFVCFLSGGVNAQSDSITSRDTIEFVYLIRNSIIQEYQDLLNFISNSATAENEIDGIIQNRVKQQSETKLFYDDKVIIDSDLKPGADADAVMRREMTVDQYLRDFHTSYTKTDEPTVSFNITGISALKKKDYLFYNVVFECTYYGTTTKGQSFKSFSRTAEIGLVKDGRWKMYIRAVRFPLGNELDGSNIYKDIKRTDTDLEKIYRSLNDEKEAERRREQLEIQKLMYEGDDAFEDKKYEQALGKYREARLKNLANKEPLDKIEKTQKIVKEQKEKSQFEAERQAHMNEMLAAAYKLRDNYSFGKAQVLCDSLIRDYGMTRDSLAKLNVQLTTINASLEGIETAMDRKDYKDAARKCELKIKEAKDDLSKAEFNYRFARVYFVSDRSEVKKMLQYSTAAIDASGKRHQEALRLRAMVYDSTGQISNAIEDATLMINNDYRNPDLYSFRALIYERDKLFDRAIEDYGKAISNNTTDQTMFLKKTVIEFNLGRFDEVRKTTTAGVVKHTCYGSLFYYRGMANEKLGDYVNAGIDFRKARACGIVPAESENINKISTSYIAAGDAKLLSGQFIPASADYSKSIDIDSSNTALYNRGLCYLKVKDYEKALKDFSALVRVNPKYQDANHNRGLALNGLDRCAEAIPCFEDELKNYKDNAAVWMVKGKCELKLEKNEDAAKSFQKSGELVFSDSAYYFASLAYFKSKNYLYTVSMSEKARSNKTKIYEVYFLAGRAHYEMHNYKMAVEELKQATALKLYDEVLLYNYGLALEANRQFEDAAGIYEKLSAAAVYKDSVLLRGGICLARTHEEEYCNRAIQKLNRYLINVDPADKSEVNAWIAYCYLNNDALVQADEFIEKSKQNSEPIPLLHFVLACKNAKAKLPEEALQHLDKALASKNFTREDVESERMLKNITKNDRYKSMMLQYFPGK